MTDYEKAAMPLEKTVDETDSIQEGIVGLDAKLYPVPQPYKIGFIKIPNYYSTFTQVLLVGFVNFLSVGMFNVLSSLGGAGQVDTKTADDSNTILYSLFAFFAILGGSAYNILGARVTLTLGSLGYTLYGASFWCYNYTANRGFVLFGGAACGVGAALLWVACGAVIMSYPTEKEKGRFVAMFFFLSFLGAVIGGIIPVAQNANSTDAGSINNGTYCALTVLMIVSSLVSLFVAPVDKIIRSDGTKVLVNAPASVMKEVKNTIYTLRTDSWFILFLPFSMGALFYIPYQANDFNSYFFNVRTRSLNGLLYGISQLVASVLFGFYLDFPKMSRRVRAISGWLIVLVAVVTINTCGYFPAAETHRGQTYTPIMDWTDKNAAKYIALYFFYGWQDGMFQAYAFWVMGSLSNDPLILSTYASFYKVMGATGAAIGFGVDALKISYMRMFGSYYGVLLFGALCLGPLVVCRVKNSSLEDDLKTAAQQDRLAKETVLSQTADKDEEA